MTILRSILFIFLASFSLIFTSIVIRACLNYYHYGVNDTLEKKFIYLQKSPIRHDVLFAGSSYLYRSVKPILFNDYMKSNDIDCNSYSFAEPGSYAFESQYFINRFIDFSANKKPSYILIDLFPIAGKEVVTVKRENRFNDRMIRYHDLYTTYLNSKAILLTDWGKVEKIKEIYEHILHFLYYITNTGSGHLFAKPYKLANSDVSKVIDYNGYYPELKGDKLHKKGYTQEEGLRYFSEYKSLLANLGKDGLKSFLQESELAFRKAQFTRLQENGIKVIYIIPPIPHRKLLTVRALCETAGFPVCFYMDDPQKYPSLFSYENRYDMGHLNDSGADHYSRYIAARFVEYLETGK